jgi:hypothetical protein
MLGRDRNRRSLLLLRPAPVNAPRRSTFVDVELSHPRSYFCRCRTTCGFSVRCRLTRCVRVLGISRLRRSTPSSCRYTNASSLRWAEESCRYLMPTASRSTTCRSLSASAFSSLLAISQVPSSAKVTPRRYSHPRLWLLSALQTSSNTHEKTSLTSRILSSRCRRHFGSGRVRFRSGAIVESGTA